MAGGYAWQFVYPAASNWPPLELWFEDRLCAQTNRVRGGASGKRGFGFRLPLPTGDPSGDPSPVKPLK